MSPAEYDYWLRTKASYELNLKSGIGHEESIKIILDKINKKLSNVVTF